LYAAHSKYDLYAKLMKWHYYFYDPRVREPIVFAVAFCKSDRIFNPFSDEMLEFYKDEFVFVLLAFDFIVICSTIFFFWLLRKRFR
jgi:hypothetical protein